MNPIWGNLIGAGIVLMTVVFVAIWYWAWRPRHKRKFDAMARLPMHDTDEDDR
ncbi:hypothetical protein LYSHEL_27610 [Lysobacter helvus]|uniref:Cbb3-type cytochrome c oxidase subunit 3 n=2 Tax=Lysobacteraceae TaxID=32033 RepID=A0ABM7Q8K6_9GAMM|nr:MULTISPECIES: cbb3-type cytochrome c oxidase subunit 3 [Lysobacter]BCT93734.1 hypothetical protein LYSCAS_27580 [Lysobacter caseinilyticus]BCT96890.1 hypothetical protein LYSHEL_27610 [Lysobacter helvus]